MNKRRPKGSGSVYKRGRYWYLRYTLNGKDIRESARVTNFNDAMSLLARRMSWTARGDVPLEIDGEPIGWLPADLSIEPGAVEIVVPLRAQSADRRIPGSPAPGGPAR